MLRLEIAKAALLLIDVQEKFIPTLDGAEGLLRQCRLLLQGANVLGLPVLATEQYPEKLGKTVGALRELIPNVTPVPKLAFSAYALDAIQKRLKVLGSRQLLVAGIETHVCVMQTVLDALDQGLDVFVVRDAVTSRTAESRDAAMARMQQVGAQLVTVEMALFEMLREAGTEPFKQLSRLVK